MNCFFKNQSLNFNRNTKSQSYVKLVSLWLPFSRKFQKWTWQWTQQFLAESPTCLRFSTFFQKLAWQILWRFTFLLWIHRHIPKMVVQHDPFEVSRQFILMKHFVFFRTSQKIANRFEWEVNLRIQKVIKWLKRIFVQFSTNKKITK